MRLGFKFGIDSVSGGWNVNKNLALHYTSRSGLDLLETKSGLNLNAKIIPSCAKIDASNYLSLSTTTFGTSLTSGYVEALVYYNGTSTPIYIFTSNDAATNGRNFNLTITSGKPTITVESTVPTVGNSYRTTNAISTGWHTIKYESVGGAYHIYVDGVEPAGTLAAGSNDGAWISSVQSRDNINIGIQKRASQTASQLFYISYVDFNNQSKWYLTGIGAKEYDVIGTNHLTWTGTEHIYYDINASTYLLDSGYSIWTKSGQIDEYVPYKNGLPMDTSLGLIGYEKRASYPGTITTYNYAPSLVDFDYNDGANALLDSLNKANTTYHIASGSMDYYDASNTYRWRNDELANPRVYSEEYKKVGYRGLMCLKSNASNGLLLNASEILVYSVDNIGANQWNLAKYCTIDSIVAQSGGQPVYDANDYITYNALPTDLTALSIAFIGDSTMANHASGLAQFEFFNLYTQFSTYNIAATGHTINQQKTLWDAITSENKLLFDYVLIQIGLNDLADTTTNFINNYQALINKINTDTKASCKIVVSTMSPCFGFVTNETNRTRFLDANTAISGGGATPITGTDFKNTLNTSLLADPVNYLAPAYDSYGDHLHPDNAGRLVIFNNYLPYIVR
jgi:hypothetical protein